MLKVVNLQKIYNTGTTTEVRALDGVTLEFPEKGMVFLLGRSGSGKSTLLNVAGGLDAPSGGEIIVKGKSSKDFSQSDFDSYRNTFVGFIFQEYNILNEFTVEDNIALALELQGKPKDKAAVAALLEQVDLSGYAKRKPNTLSGGQKQRIAIARALIKSPEIIMADEPTGALDSNTGKQVFDTLKKLSADKLVIVVSHDREFAEQYGDRIIELKDGKILSDITKTTVVGDAVSKNVSSLGDVLCIKKGADLTENDFEKIKAFLKETDGDVVIANGEKSVSDFKKVNRIRDTGEKEVFSETDESKMPKKQYTKEDAKFIRSRLPLRHAIRIGSAGLKTKPFRLIFTILLCTIAFVLFGVLSTMTFYDSAATLRQTLMDSSMSVLRIEKQYKMIERTYENGELAHEFESHADGRFSPTEIASFRAQYGDGVFGAVSANLQLGARTPSGFYQKGVLYFASLEEGHPLISTAIPGSTYPEKENEIWLSTYTADVLINSTAYDANKDPLEINSANELIGKEISLGSMRYKVTGVFDSGSIDTKYEVLKEESTNKRLEYEFTDYLADGLYQLAFLSKEGIETYVSIYGGMNYYAMFGEKQLVYADDYEDGKFLFSENVDDSNAKYSSMDDMAPYVNVEFFNKDKTTLAANETVIPASVFYSRMEYALEEMRSNLGDLDPESAEEKVKKYITLAQYARWLANGKKSEYSEEMENQILIPLTDEEKKAYHKELMTVFDGDETFFNISFRLLADSLGGDYGETFTQKIVGVYTAKNPENGMEPVLLFHEDLSNVLFDEQRKQLTSYHESVTMYTESPDALFTTLFLAYDGSAEKTDAIVALYQAREAFSESDWSRIVPRSALTDGFQMADEMIGNLTKVFLWGGLILAVFAALLFSNFISVSISHKRREIGILRAVGARGADVFKIFFAESFIIAAICIALSITGSILVCGALNNEVASMMGASMFVFGAFSVLMLVGVALLTAVMATFLPVYHAARRKPVDSIRSL